jgi:phenylpropionate dioxygenase-like ring-hydroxylating dioxygenase large terminal subunit
MPPSTKRAGGVTVAEAMVRPAREIAPENPDNATALRTALARTAELPYDQAWSMPGSFYGDPAILALERAHLFRREWICVGRVEEVARPGDYMAIEIAEEPVVVVHGLDGRIRALSNVCRHRGTLIARGKGHGTRLVCPYHNWAYDMAGQLMAAPRIPPRPDFNPASCRLPEFAAAEWQGFLFVCLAADPPPLSPRLAALEAMIRPYHLEQTALRYLAEEVWETNWKCLLENYMEGYHLSPLHRDSLHKVNPTRLCRHIPPGEAHFGYKVGFAAHLSDAQKGHAEPRNEEVEACVMFALPPGFAVGCASDYSSFICLQPAAVDRVRVKMGLIFFGPDWPQETVDAAVALFQKTMAEDKAVLVDMARGLQSRHHAPGPLAPADFEGPLLDFYRYMGRRLVPAMDEPSRRTQSSTLRGSSTERFLPK